MRSDTDARPGPGVTKLAKGQRVLRDTVRRPGYIVVAVAAVGWAFMAPNHMIFTSTSALIHAIVALGLLVLTGWAREVSLAQASLVGTAVYMSAYFYRPNDGGQGWPYLVAAAAAIAVVTACMLAVSLVSVRLSGVYVMVLTLGLQFTLERIVFSRGEFSGGREPFSWNRPWVFGLDIESDRAFYFLILAVLCVVLLGMARLRRSRFGLSLLMMGSDRRAAAALGISPYRYKMFAFALCGMLAGLGGVLFASLYEVPPIIQNYTSFNSLFYLAIPVLAGFESVFAVVIVSLPLSLVPQWLESLNLNTLLMGGLALVTGTLMGSRGVGGLVSDRWRKLRRRQWRQGVQIVDLRSVPVVSVTDGQMAANANGHAESPAMLGLVSDDFDDRRQRALEVFEAWLPPRPEGDVALVARDISLSFGGVHALSGVTMTIPTGALVGLIGPNGAGKSTMFDVINGLKRPDSGTVELFGVDVSAKRAWDRAALGMSRTFQANRINLDLTASDNLLAGAHTMIGGGLPGTLAGLPGSWAGMRRAEEAAWAVAELLNIDQHWDELAGTLSFGNRRRIEIGRSLLAGPRLLLLDEPAAGLDPAGAGILFSLVRRLHQDLGLTVLMVEHYVRAVLENCDLVYVLNYGELTAVGTPAEVAGHPDVRSQYLGEDFEFNVARARGEKTADRRGIDIGIEVEECS